MASNEKELLANIPPFGLRMQPQLKEWIKEAAAANNRSMNAEIVARLERSFSPNGGERSRLTNAEKDELWDWIQQRARADIETGRD